jgi:hypothetical protein
MIKKNLILAFMILISVTVWGQENMVTLSGGYAFANIDDADENATGWRINGTYEFNAFQGKYAQGISFGYISTMSTAGNTEHQINSWPIYFAPKYLFGGDSFKGFVKGAIGGHFSNIKSTGPTLIVESSANGFYGGVGAGAMYTFSDKIFINLEYEWAYMGSSYYRDGFMNSVMLGLGIIF